MAEVRSGRITVTTAGTEEAGPTTSYGTYLIKPLSSNTGTVYVGMGTVGGVLTSSNGYELEPGDAGIPILVDSLSDLKFDVDTSGEGVSWLKIS